MSDTEQEERGSSITSRRIRHEVIQIICVTTGVRNILELHLKGIWIADPTLTYGVIQQDVPALRFIQVYDYLEH